MNLRDWLDEYRQLSPDDVPRYAAEVEDDWAGDDLLAPADRVRDTTPRWLARASHVELARPTTL